MSTKNSAWIISVKGPELLRKGSTSARFGLLVIALGSNSTLPIDIMFYHETRLSQLERCEKLSGLLGR